MENEIEYWIACGKFGNHQEPEQRIYTELLIGDYVCFEDDEKDDIRCKVIERFFDARSNQFIFYVKKVKV